MVLAGFCRSFSSERIKHLIVPSEKVFFFTIPKSQLSIIDRETIGIFIKSFKFEEKAQD